VDGSLLIYLFIDGERFSLAFDAAVCDWPQVNAPLLLLPLRNSLVEPTQLRVRVEAITWRVRTKGGSRAKGMLLLLLLLLLLLIQLMLMLLLLLAPPVTMVTTTTTWGERRAEGTGRRGKGWCTGRCQRATCLYRGRIEFLDHGDGGSGGRNRWSPLIRCPVARLVRR